MQDNSEFKMPVFKDKVSLIPYGLPQFLDFEVTPQKGKVSMTFVEAQISDDEGKSGYQLNELRMNREEGYLESPDGKGEYQGDDFYTLNSDKNLGPWLEKWIPVPFFRQSGDFYDDGRPRFRHGPSNWARAFITRVPSLEDPDIKNWRIILAFDMQVEEQQNQKHAALTPDDVTARALCSLADAVEDNSWWLTEGWVDSWLKSIWDTYFLAKEHQRERPKMAERDDLPIHLDYLASYLLYLRMLKKAINNVSVQIVNLAGTQDRAADSHTLKPIDVDLILDIGNSRSTGILVENQLNKPTDLNDSYRLQLRDISHPERFYSEPFETRVEFSKADFGSVAFSKRSGRRTNAFTWASPVRTGPEATRLGNSGANAEGTSGMSSPKRYLWDQDESGELWYFSKQRDSDREELITSHPICKYLNNAGTPISCIKELNGKGEKPQPGQPAPQAQKKSYLAKLFDATLKECKKQTALPATQPHFSKSSMMMFLFMELILQALITINSPAQRHSRDLQDRPRRLRSVIFTVPPGMPFAEQRIYRRWAHAAVKTLWEALGWYNNFYVKPTSMGERSKESIKASDYRINPDIRCSWDEATCTQLVYLHNEINRNYEGDAHLFFEIMGRRREVPRELDPSKKEMKHTLRMATIDIGGGTTDLSIITYVLANDKSTTNRIWPIQEIRDGLNLGGDDVLKSIVTTIVCKSLVENLAKRGISQEKADRTISDMFGKKSQNMLIQKSRIKLLRQIALPLAYEILQQYEKIDLRETNGEINISLRSFFHADEESANAGPREKARRFFRESMESSLGQDVDIMDFDINIHASDVDKAISGIVHKPLGGMAELINMYDCDVLLLTGRPSRWNAVVRQIYAMIPVAPDRIVPMHTYLVGPWYPFASTSGKITDPKTTVVTGAILCTLAQNSIEGFSFNANKLELKSTARYIGELDNHGSLSREKVWFPNLNPDKKKGEEEYVHVVEFSSSPTTIGFRQLETPRWTAQRCWSMEFADEAARSDAEGKTPYLVRVRFNIPEEDEKPEDIPPAEKDINAQLDEPVVEGPVFYRKMEDGKMVEVEAPGKQPVVIHMRTLSKKEEDGCWMDTATLFD